MNTSQPTSTEPEGGPPRGRLTRRGLVLGAAAATALALRNSALAADRGTTIGAGMARAAGAVASAEAEAQRRLAAAMGTGAAAGTDQGVSIARGAAASAMANAHGVAETNGAVASAAAASGVGAATKSAVTEAVVVAPAAPKPPAKPVGRMALPRPRAFARMAAPRGGRGGGGGRNRRMRAVGGAAPARLPRTGDGPAGFGGPSALLGIGAAAAAGIAWLNSRAGRIDDISE